MAAEPPSTAPRQQSIGWDSHLSPQTPSPVKEKDDDHPLALHNIPTGRASHHEDIGLSQTDSTLHKTSSSVARRRSLLGLTPSAPISEEHDYAEHSDWWWPKVRMALREPFAEFFGVFIMVLFGDGAVAQVLLSAGEKSAPGGNGYGAYNAISWGWGLGVMLGVYVAGDSGAYLKYRPSLNTAHPCSILTGHLYSPAITLTNCLLRKLPLRRFPIYLLAQFLGGFVAAGVIYGNYINGIDSFEGGSALRTVPPSKTATAGIFCTYPQPDLTKASQFFSEFIASAILMFVIFAMKDDSNKGSFSASGAWFPLGLFFLIFGLGACFGWDTGYVSLL